MKALGLVTARGGSKGIVGKNIKRLLGKPLISYTIEAAQKSGVFDRLILSTDDEEIADVAYQLGCETPFIRPSELALDTTPHLPVLQHAVSWLKLREGYSPDVVMLLQPTAPLRQAYHIREAVQLLERSKADSVVGVSELPGHYSPYWIVVTNENGWGQLFSGDDIKDRIPRRQAFPRKVYAHNGAIYLFETRLLFEAEPSFYGKKVKLYPMDPKYNIDLDEPHDWTTAEVALKRFNDERFKHYYAHNRTRPLLKKVSGNL